MVTYSPAQLTYYDWAIYHFVKAMSEPHKSNRQDLEQKMWFNLFIGALLGEL